MGLCRLDADLRRLGDTGVLVLCGDLDITTLPTLSGALADAVASVPPLSVLVVDLDGVLFCGARGLGALLRAAEDLRGRGGRLVLARRPVTVLRLMDLLSVETHPCLLHHPGFPTGVDAVELPARAVGPDPALR